jgi:hypothetical protein
MDAMRGTNFVAGLRWLREQGLQERYLSALRPTDRASVLSVQATEWVPMALVMTHYAALDALELDANQMIDFGASVSRNINGVVLSTIASLAGRVGLSPLVPLKRAAKIFARNFRGGAVGIYQTGATEARVDVLGAPMATSATHRGTIVGGFLDGARPFAANVRANEISAQRTARSYAIRLRW